jgi:hypothetical protein
MKNKDFIDRIELPYEDIIIFAKEMVSTLIDDDTFQALVSVDEKLVDEFERLRSENKDTTAIEKRILEDIYNLGSNDGNRMDTD